MDLFRVTCFVEDKNLAKAMRALTGIARDVRSEPVVNVEGRRNGKLAAATGGTVGEMLAHWVVENKMAEVTPAQVREFLKSVGRSPQSASYALRQAVLAKALKRTGKGFATRYTVAS